MLYLPQLSSPQFFRSLCIGLGLWMSMPAHAVLIDSGDGSGNTTAPADDPGFVHVALRSQFSAVYVGNGWVLTANHTGIGPVEIDGTVYPEVTGSKVQFDDGGTPADLMAFQIDPAPALPILPINSVSDLTGASVTMIGNGNDRGPSVTECTSIDGYDWSGSKSMRWGTNEITGYTNVSLLGLPTAVLYTTFDQLGSTHEAQVANGDSGGALFVKNGGTWELAGILVALGPFPCQPTPILSSLYGNLAFAVDLATYRDQIIATVRPQCSDEEDNDGDGFIDFPADADCTSLEDDQEKTVGVPGIGPAGLTALATALLAGAAQLLHRHARQRPLPARAPGGGGPTARTTPGRGRTRRRPR